jgi:hypothetical protein
LLFVISTYYVYAYAYRNYGISCLTPPFQTLTSSQGICRALELGRSCKPTVNLYVCTRTHSTQSVCGVEVVSFEPLLCDASGVAIKERPTPVFIANGEGLPTEVWSPLISALQAKGFSGLVCPFPTGTSHIDEVAQEFQAAITGARMVPPVMIAHSLSTLCALNFLESYSLAGLVILNPVPPTPTSAVREAAHILTERAERQPLSVHTYYGIERGGIIPSANAAQVDYNELPMELLRRLTKGKELLLERGVVPTLVVLSSADALLLGDAGGSTETALLDMCGAEEGDEQTIIRLAPVQNQKGVDSSSNQDAQDIYGDPRCVQKVVEWLDELL